MTDWYLISNWILSGVIIFSLIILAIAYYFKILKDEERDRKIEEICKRKFEDLIKEKGWV